MELDLVPILADAIKGYYEENELIELCDLYDIDLDFDGIKPAYMRLARELISGIRDSKKRDFLKAMTQSLLNRAREGAAKTKWDRQDYHRAMADSIVEMKNQLDRITSELKDAETNEQILATVDEVASLLRTDAKSVETILESGELDGFKIGNEWKVRTESVVGFLKQQITDQRMKSLIINLQKPEVWARELKRFPELPRLIKETQYEAGSMGAFLKDAMDENKPKRNANMKPVKEITPPGLRDVFICHAGEDKEKIVEPLVAALDKEGVSYWYDRAEIRWGDSLTRKVNQGLSISKFVIVVLTKTFIGKHWPRRELDSALNIEAKSGAVKVLPLLCGSTQEREEILKEFPLLNDKYYIIWEEGSDDVISQLKNRLKESDT